MKLRVARHTSDLKPLVDFYTTILGLTILGRFTDHAGYDGVFIGNENHGWHLEFTTSTEAAHHHPDEDDLLVFYVTDIEEYNDVTKKAMANNVKQSVPKNPYWADNGSYFLDPDGFGVVITIG